MDTVHLSHSNGHEPATVDNSLRNAAIGRPGIPNRIKLNDCGRYTTGCGIKGLRDPALILQYV